jgi:hypothetical protein
VIGAMFVARTEDYRVVSDADTKVIELRGVIGGNVETGKTLLENPESNYWAELVQFNCSECTINDNW